MTGAWAAELCVGCGASSWHAKGKKRSPSSSRSLIFTATRSPQDMRMTLSENPLLLSVRLLSVGNGLTMTGFCGGRGDAGFN